MIALSVDALAERASSALSRPSSFGTTDPEAFTTHGAVFSVHRDSDALDRANWQSFRRTLDAEPYADDVYVMGCRHWAVGWVDHLMVKVYDGPAYTPAFIAACELLDALDDYPVLDEELWSDTEWSENHPDDETCYSDDPDCPCGTCRHPVGYVNPLTGDCTLCPAV